MRSTKQETRFLVFTLDERLVEQEGDVLLDHPRLPSHPLDER